MTIKRWDAKRDLAEKEIVEYLRARGCSVTRLDQPVDLLLGIIQTVAAKVSGTNVRMTLETRLSWILAEVKTGDGELTGPQITFFREHAGYPLWILRKTKDVDEMLSFYGVT